MKTITKVLMFAVILAFTVAAPKVQAAVADHALGKAASIVAAPVIHPKRSAKQVIGSVLFAGESVVDVVRVGLDALDKGSATELKAFNRVIHPAAVVIGKADAGIERAEQYFFGYSN